MNKGNYSDSGTNTSKKFFFFETQSWLVKFIKGKTHSLKILISKKNLRAKSYELGWNSIWHQYLQRLVHENLKEERTPCLNMSLELRLYPDQIVSNVNINFI